MAKRWLVLQSNGQLSYSMQPNHKARDTCSISSASIGLSELSRTMVIDTGVAVWKIQFLSKEDYARWLQALRTARAQFKEHQSRHAHKRAASRTAFNKAIAEEQKSTHNEWQKAVSGLDKPLSDLEALVASLKEETLASSSQSSHESHNGHSKFLQLFGKKSPSGHHESSHQSSGQQQQLPDSKMHKMEKLLRDLRSQQEHLAALSGRPAPDFRRLSFDGANLTALSVAEDPNREASEEAQNAPPSLQEHSEEEEDDFGSVLSRSESVYHDALTPQEYEIEAEAEPEADDKETKDSEDEAEAEDDESEHSPASTGGGAEASTGSLSGDVQRRTKLPAPVTHGGSSVVKILRNNVGKDLSRIAMPVDFNEPLSALQKRCEEFQYTALLREAADTEDDALRVAKIAAFVAAGFATAKHRIQRKPFNPLLGETFEAFRADRGIEFFAEKVQHHPPVLLSYAADPEGKWQYHGSIGSQEKFLGRSFEITPKEDNHLTLKSSGITVSWTKPSAYVRGLMTGDRYIENVGMLHVNASNGWAAEVEFKEGSTWGGASSRNKISGKIKDPNGQAIASLQGRWDESITMTNLDTKETTDIWQIDEVHGDPQEYYGFTPFGIELNEITPDIKEHLPPTDSRLRPDQRALEEGDVPKAEELKSKVEELQRSQRTSLEKENMLPEWFVKGEDGHWQFKREAYLKSRNDHDWDERVKIFAI